MFPFAHLYSFRYSRRMLEAQNERFSPACCFRAPGTVLHPCLWSASKVFCENPCAFSTARALVARLPRFPHRRSVCQMREDCVKLMFHLHLASLIRPNPPGTVVWKTKALPCTIFFHLTIHARHSGMSCTNSAHITYMHDVTYVEEHIHQVSLQNNAPPQDSLNYRQDRILG